MKISHFIEKCEKFSYIDRVILMKEFDMKEIVYREARLDEYQKLESVGWCLYGLPFMTLIKDDLKKPEYYPAFLELLYSLLTRLYIQRKRPVCR